MKYNTAEECHYIHTELTLLREQLANNSQSQGCCEFATKKDLENIYNQISIIMATQAEQAAKLRDVEAQLVKINGEIGTVQTEVNTLKEKVTELEGLVGEASPELVAAVEAVSAQTQVVDDSIPDPVVVPS